MFLFCSVKRKARRVLTEVAKWLMRRPPLMRTPADGLAAMALMHEPGSGEKALADDDLSLIGVCARLISQEAAFART